MLIIFFCSITSIHVYLKTDNEQKICLHNRSMNCEERESEFLLGATKRNGDKNFINMTILGLKNSKKTIGHAVNFNSIGPMKVIYLNGDN